MESRGTWSNLFMKNHGLVPMNGFYAWVPGENGKPRLIYFYPEDKEMMWAPCLWDEWTLKDGRIHFKSFAIIPDEPRPEILEMRHDRSPIFIRKDLINEWLNTSIKKDFYQILKNIENNNYKYQWVS